MQSVVAQTSRKNRILFAAVEEFSSKGLAGARTAEIARRAGVNKQLIFYYFGSKRGLYDTVVKQAGGRLVADASSDVAAREPKAPAERIRHILRSVYRAVAEQPELARLLVRGLTEDRVAAAELEEFVRGLVGEIADQISEGQGMGYFRDGVDPHVAGRQAVVLVLGYLALEGPLAHGPAHEARAEWLERTCDLLIGSLTWS